MKKFLLFISFISIAAFAFCQKQNNQWRLGGTGINFNTNPPSQVQGSAMNTPEGSASVADRNTGELLFYTDGVTVWNAQNQVMQNGTMLRGGSSLLSSTTAAVIVPKPGSDSLYYIITVDEGASGSGSGGIRYNLVDMSLAGGLGAIVPGQKNILLFQSNTERLETVPAANGTDVWIVTHESSNFVSFRLTSAGIMMNPVESVVSGDLSNTAGHLKVNRQFNMLACGSLFEGKLRLFNFNNATGVVSDRIAVSLGPVLSFSPLIYGLEFSPGGRFLYVSNLFSIVQFDVSLPTAQAIENSLFLLNTGGQPASLQLGPDKKIYINNGSLNVISCPDQPGNFCGYETGTLAGGGYGLPKWVYYADDSPANAFSNAILRQDSCLSDTIRFSLRNTEGLTSVKWDFGDPGSASNTASGFETGHVFSQAGNYSVRAILTTACGEDTLFLNNVGIRICNPPCAGVIVRSPDTCAGSSISFSVSGPEVLSLSWNFGDPLSGSENVSSLKNATHIYRKEGSYLVKAMVNFSCGTDTLELPLSLADCDCSGIIITAIDSCSGLVTFSVQTDEEISLLKWDFGIPSAGQLNTSAALSPVFEYAASGTYRVKTVVLFGCGLDTLEKEVSLVRCPKPEVVCSVSIPNAISPNGDGINDVFQPLFTCTPAEFEIVIYNRWGTEVFRSNNVAENWKPGSSGKEHTSGGAVYFYSLKHRFEGKNAVKTNGYFTLLESR